MAIKTVLYKAILGSAVTIPSDFVSLISVEAIGGGAGGTGNAYYGGGGGAYAKSTSVSLSANQTVYIYAAPDSLGNGQDSWFNAVSNAAPTRNLHAGIIIGF